MGVAIATKDGCLEGDFVPISANLRDNAGFGTGDAVGSFAMWITQSLTSLLTAAAYASAITGQPFNGNRVSNSALDGRPSIAQRSLCSQPLPQCRADIDPPGGNGTVNVNDLLAVINTWGQDGNPSGVRPQGDCDPPPIGNCVVDVNDLLAVINGWGACPPPQPTGACCFANGGCCTDTMTPQQCSDAGGLFAGTGTTCPAFICTEIFHDVCTGAITVSNGTTVFTNCYASSVGGPSASCVTGGPQNFTRDVWLKYTATCSGPRTLDLCATTGPVTDTVLAVYVGTCQSLIEVGCNDNGTCGGSQSLLSRVILVAQQGQQFLIRVGSWGTAPANQGTMMLSIAPDC